jgi:tetratricopeptide (TPR) repeat protein
MDDPNLAPDPQQGARVSASGPRSVAIGGDVSHSLIVPGDNVTIYALPGGQHETRTRRVVPLAPPYAPNPFFVGRDAILCQLHRAFTQGERPAVVQAVNGLGGVGKTQVAVEYAHRYRGDYQDILWVRTEDPALLVSDFARLALDLGLIRQPSADVAGDARRTLRELNGPVSRLLILDNAPDEEAVRAWLPVTGKCRTVITSRFTSWSPAVRAIDVGALEPDAARDFLVRRTGLADSEANQRCADRLAEELGCLPLALEQAAAFIKEAGVSFDRYLEYFAEARSRRDLLARRVLGSTHYPESVAATWLTTMQRLGPLARLVLNLAAFLAADAIPRNLIWEARDLLQEGLQQPAETVGQGHVEVRQFDLDQALGQLNRYSMIRLAAESFSVHRLVQAVVRDGSDESIQAAWAGRAVLAVDQVFPDPDFSNWGECAQLLPHARAAATWVEQWGFVAPEVAHLLQRTAFYLRHRGEYPYAEILLRQALEITREVLGEEDLNYAISLNNLASLYEARGEYTKAEPLYNQSLTILRAVVGERHPNIVTALSNLAGLYNAQGRYGEAESLYGKGMEIAREVLGKAHPDYANLMNNLAELYREQGRYAEAEPLNIQALECRRKALGEGHPKVATSRNNLALLYWSMGKYDKAEPLYLEARETTRAAVGEAHPHYAMAINNLAGVYMAQGRYAEAKPLYLQALEIRRSALGERHPDYATALNNLAHWHAAQGEEADAEPLYAQALKIKCEALGEEHPDTVNLLNNLGVLYQRKGEHSKAESLHQRALEISRKSQGESHPDVAASLNFLGVLYQAKGAYEKAQAMCLRALEIRRNALGEYHPHYAISLSNLASLYGVMGKSAEAVTLCGQALEILRHALGDNHLDYLIVRDKLACLWCAQRQYGKAEPIFRETLETACQVLGERHHLVLTTLEHCANMLRITGRSDEAARLEARAAVIRGAKP